ncbi:hypothetical protein JCM30237_19710 [Halolamina litorea]|uniref:Integral membrane protein n=1 Tax=Halolamina litorea TaxID=1515593 RepID=A0ABD6BUF4_9EURY|nr:hypothetical protein [Halolamina litorea]
MVESVVVGVGLLVVVTVAGIGVAAWRFAATGERPLLPLAGAAAAFAGVFTLGQIGGYFRPLRATAMAALSVLAALTLVVMWARER